MRADSDEATQPGSAVRVPVSMAAREFRRQLFLTQNARDELSRTLPHVRGARLGLDRLVAELAHRCSVARDALAAFGARAMTEYERALFEQAQAAWKKSRSTIDDVLVQALKLAELEALGRASQALRDDNSCDEDLDAVGRPRSGTTHQPPTESK